MIENRRSPSCGLALGTSRPSAPRFGNALKTAAGPVGKYMQALDFEKRGVSTLAQIKLIYGLCILSRLVAAANRSWNEVRETALRDSLGYSFWFFATPLVQRLFLLSNKRSRVLVNRTPAPKADPGLKGKLTNLGQRVNLLSRWEIPSTSQLHDRMVQAVEHLKEEKASPETIKQTEQAFKKLIKYRNLSSAVGIGMTIALLGVGINLVNIAMTRKKVAEGKVGRGG